MKTRILIFYLFILSLLTGADVFAAVDVTLKSADDVAIQHDFDLDIYMSGGDEVAIFRIYLEFDNSEIQITGFASHVGDDLITPSGDALSACNETGNFVLLYSSPNPFIPLPEKKVVTISCKTLDQTGVAGFRFFGRTYIKNSGFPPESVTGILTGKTIRIVPQPPMYKITASGTPPEGGTISNVGEKFYEAGETPEYLLTVNEGYEITGFSVSSDLNAKLIDNVYKFLPLSEDAVITVAFEKMPPIIINASASPAEGGRIEPSRNVSVNIGADQTFRVTANAGWRTESVTVDGNPAVLDSDGTYTFSNVEGNHSIAAVFAKEGTVVPAVISASASPAEGGKIEPSGNVAVDIGADQTFRVTANAGWRTESVTVDGNPAVLNSDGTYIFRSVDKNHSIAAFFVKEGTVVPAVINASASPAEGGRIEPSGNVSVNIGADQAFRVTANAGWRTESVTVDGSRATLNSDGIYTFSNVDRNHSIAAVFAKEGTVVPAIINASASPYEGGKIEPSGNVSVNIGADQMFRVTANEGWRTESVTVDGNAAVLDSDGTYTFRSVDKNHSIAAFFVKEGTVVPAVINASASPAEGGKIEPSGNVSVNIGADQTFRVTANAGWRTALVMVDGTPTYLASGETYTFSNVAGDHSISVVFAKEGTVIIASASPAEGGKIEPSGWVLLVEGTTPSFRVTANAGWRTESVTVDGSPVTLTSNGTYIFGPIISGNHTITAYFEKEDTVVPAVINASAAPAEGGQIEPSGDVSVNIGSDQTFRVTANEGWRTESVTVDGNPAVLDADGTYTFSKVEGNHSIAAFFVKEGTVVPAVINASASPAEGGKIEPSGSVSVNIGSDQTFRVTANAGWRTESMTVDGNPAVPDSDGTYVFRNVDKNHSISAVFVKEGTVVPAVINASASPAEGGRIEPSGNVSVNIGSDQTFRVTANAGWRTESVTVDGNAAVLDSEGAYTFHNVEGNHSIAAVFVKEGTVVPAVINASASPSEGGKIEPSGNVSVNIGADQIFRVTANEGWRTESVTVDGNPAVLGSDGTYTFRSVDNNHSIAVVFVKEPVIVPAVINASASPAEGGRIEPSRDVVVSIGTDRTFTVIPNEGWEIEIVTVDENPAGLAADNTYTFKNIEKNHIIKAFFIKNDVLLHTITASASPAEGGSIEPSGNVTVEEGKVRTFKIIVNQGWEAVATVDEIIVPIGADGTYTFQNVYKDSIFTVNFVYKEEKFHSADYDRDFHIGLRELLRVLQFYEYGGYHCDSDSEDGYAPLGDGSNCKPHDSDYDNPATQSFQNWKIELGELLRLVQFYNSAEGYRPDPSGEDGFVLGN